MNQTTITLIIAVVMTFVLTGIGMHLVNKYGSTNEKLGASKCAEFNNAAIVETIKADAIALEKIDNETKKLPDTAIDTDLTNLGIMRDD